MSDRAVVVRQGWRLGEQSVNSSDKPPSLVSEKSVEIWERESLIRVGIGSCEMALSVDGARRLARLLNDLALRVEKRLKENAALKIGGTPK